MQLWAGREIIGGAGYSGWTSHFWPPLYSVLTGFFDLFIDGFWAAKLVSILSSAILVYFVFLVANEIFQKKYIGILAQLFLIFNPVFLLFSIEAENHMLESLFYVMAFFFFLKSINNYGRKFFVLFLLLSSLAMSLACLSRYTSYAAVPIYLIFGFVFLGFRGGLKYASIFLISFLSFSSPWFIINWKSSGSPLSTWQYLNIGYAAIGAKSQWWWWEGQNYYHKIMEIIKSSPLLYIKNFLTNFFIKGPASILLASGLLVIFFIYKLIVCCWQKTSDKFENKLVFLIFALLIINLFTVSNAFVGPEFVLPISIVTAIFGAGYLIKKMGAYHLKKYFISVWLIVGLLICVSQYLNYLKNTDWNDGQQIPGLQLIVDGLRKYDENISAKKIMAFHPAYAYYLKSEFLVSPLYYVNSVEELVSYGGLSEKIKNYAPKYPSRIKSSEMRADYLIYDLGLKRHLPQYSFLLNKNSGEIPANFHWLFGSENFAVYKID